jgi:hypothetical protein
MSATTESATARKAKSSTDRWIGLGVLSALVVAYGLIGWGIYTLVQTL